MGYIEQCRTFGASFFVFALPDLTVGPILCRAFGPAGSSIRKIPSFETVFGCDTRRPRYVNNSPGLPPYFTERAAAEAATHEFGCNSRIGSGSITHASAEGAEQDSPG